MLFEILLINLFLFLDELFDFCFIFVVLLLLDINRFFILVLFWVLWLCLCFFFLWLCLCLCLWKRIKLIMFINKLVIFIIRMRMGLWIFFVLINCFSDLIRMEKYSVIKNIVFIKVFNILVFCYLNVFFLVC